MQPVVESGDSQTLRLKYSRVWNKHLAKTADIVTKKTDLIKQYLDKGGSEPHYPRIHVGLAAALYQLL